jgi:hypothetical protein
LQRLSLMKIAFDIASYPLIRDNDLFYPGIASLLAIIHCGGKAIVYNSRGTTTILEKRLIKKLTDSFPGRVAYAGDAKGADMSIS